MIRRFIMAATILIILSGCARFQSTAPTPTSTIELPPTETAAPTETTLPVEVGGAPPDGITPEITISDNQSTLTMSVGERFVLKLGEMYDWKVTVEDPTVVDRVKNIAVIRGSQGVYEALKPGQALLSAAGDPLCRQSTPPCEMPSMLFQLEIVVK